MKYFFFLILVIPLLFCPLLFADSILIDGIERTYLVHAPKSFSGSGKLPLVIALHGGGGKGKGMVKLSGFDDVADANNFFVVYPNGIDKQWNDGRSLAKKTHNGIEVNDVRFLSMLIDTLIRRFNIDSNRIYVTGISNGGIMSFRLACELSGKIAAIAPVAASMTPFQVEHCIPLRIIPVMLIFGNEDPLVPFEGGQIIGKRGEVISVEKCVKYWCIKDSCTFDSAVSIVDSVDDDTRAIKNTYSDVNGNSPVIFWYIEGGGHTWPGGWPYLPKLFIGRTTKQINASEEIWKFFKDKRLH
ncbi:MAG: PHB depolymerase family esterase [Ignavibacteria bacterium]|jgi:polyhydroxybutyrate depolymerase